MDAEELRFVPLGGAGEIGMNMSLYGSGGRWMMVDAGIAFGDETTPGVDVLAPDPAFAHSLGDRLAGIVITHAHEDHVGAVPHLWPRLRCPVHVSPFARGVLERKLEHAGLLDEVPLRTFAAGETVRIGPFEVRFVAAAHSIPEAHILAIRTPVGVAVHATDWKIDPEPVAGSRTDEAALRALGDEGVHLLVCDSTNAFVDGTAGSEGDLRASLRDVVGRCTGRVALASFASNVARMATVGRVAAETGRHPALVGRSLRRIEEIARDCGHLDPAMRFVPEQEVAELPRGGTFMAVTGSQGEPRAALAQIAQGRHRHVGLEEGDTVIFSSREIPGNEKAIARIQNMLVRRGVEVITDDDAFVHVSGHPARDELRELYGWLRPRMLVPIHGESRHLAQHARLARESGIARTAIAENGDMLRINDEGVEACGRVESGRLAVDGSRLVPLGSNVVRERRRMRFEGAAMATVVLDGDGELVGDPRLSLSGVLHEGEEDAVLEDTVGILRRTVADLRADDRSSDRAVAKAARRAVRDHLHDRVGKRPVTDVHVVRT